MMSPTGHQEVPLVLTLMGDFVDVEVYDLEIADL